MWKKTLLAIAALTIPYNAFAESCTQEQAYNRMMAFNRGQSRLMEETPNPTPDSPAMKLMTESGPANELMAAQKYSEACDAFSALAKKYGLDLAKEAEGMTTFAELQKDGGKRGSECGVADVSRKMMALHQQLEDRAALGDAPRDILRRYGEDTKPVGDLMVTDPGKACALLEELRVKYKLD